MSNNLQPTVDDYTRNFPFPTLRKSQSNVLNDIAIAFASGYKYIILEAPTGFGKSPVAIAVALTLGTSYICTSTKDLQSQYARDFSFLRVTKGKKNFICAVKEDFIKNGTFKCGLDSNNVNGCNHISAEHGPCISNESFKHENCRYRTYLRDYTISNEGTIEEEVFINDNEMNAHQKEYSQWSYLENLKERRAWRPCEYYHQLNIALASSHAVLNYSLLLALSFATYEGLPSRELLVLDEAHRLEEEIVKFAGISISKRRWKRYIPDLKIVDYGYDIEKWIDFLIELETSMFNLSENINEELAAEVKTDREKLARGIEQIHSNPKNWIVSEIKKENNEVTRVELKPLDVSPYCKGVFEKCNKILMMSATILDRNTFCTSLGLALREVKFIQVPSGFPLQNRPIYPLDVAYLNYDALHKDAVKGIIAAAIDRIMTEHKDHKGIIHTTSYEQLNFIKEKISKDNRRRLLETDPEIQRDEIIKEHIAATKPTVLISPSLHLGLDLKDNLSRFQVITKVPYPSLGDRWINEKRKRNEQWYKWQTALKLVQGYGRSVRSKEDWAKTYVIDSGFGPFVRNNKDILPDWFTDAIQYYKPMLRNNLAHAKIMQRERLDKKEGRIHA